MAKRARPDILLNVSYQAGKVQEPHESHKKKLNKVMSYLNGTVGAGIELEGYIDASYGVHVDGRTGALIKFNNGIVGVWTAKQSIVVKSSTEAELVALSDACVHVLWAREWLLEQGFNLKDATVIYQDNMSVLSMVKKGQV